jgi:serine/threonine protein kinase
MERLAPGTQFGSYVVEGLIASGGMGQVYAAKHQVYGTPVALKVLHESLHAHGDWRARFNEEGLIGTQLKHPNVLSARELVEEGGRIGLVLDLVGGGQTLERVLTREFPGGLPLQAALKVLLSIVQGIEYMHEKGILHGDLKPENVLLQGDFRQPESWVPKVTDFGTVALVANPVLIGGRAAVVATPRYASPEHMLGVDKLEPRSDIYCLGLILHFLLTGQHASAARSVEEAASVVSAPINVASIVDQPEPVLVIFRGCTAVDPDARPPSCRELALSIRKVLDSLGVAVDVDDLQADLATEVDEERQKAAAAAAPASEVELPEPDTDPNLEAETDPGVRADSPFPKGATPMPAPPRPGSDTDLRYPLYTEADEQPRVTRTVAAPDFAATQQAGGIPWGMVGVGLATLALVGGALLLLG